MTIPTHIAFNLGVFLVLIHATTLNPNYSDLALILGSNLIDLDHLFSKPIYHPKRNPFITHGIHKRWVLLICLSVAFLFIKPIMFLGIGLLAHLLFDYIYARREKL